MGYQLQPATSVTLGDLVEAINSAYSDYFVPLKFNEQSLAAFIDREALDLDAGVVAIEDGKIIGSCMLGIRDGAGWVGGMGIIPSHRGQGVGRAIMNYLIEQGHQRNLSHFELEVITQNTPAYKLYIDVGFETTRNLLIFDRPVIAVEPTAGYTIRKAEMDTILKRFDDFHDEPNPWQRHKSTLEKYAESISGRVLMTTAEPNQVIGYALGWFSDERVQFMDVGFDPNYTARPKAVTALFTHLLNDHPNASSGMVNVSEHDVVVLSMQELGYKQSLRQYEMKLMLG